MSRERDAFTCRASPSASPGAACEAGSDVVQLNVGGVHFTTTKSTLSAEPRSMLAAMCAPGRAFGTPLSNKSTPGVAVGSPHATGPVPVHFLDRCGERFKHVLNWLRNGTLPGSAAWDEGLLLELQEEAQYFALQGLVDTCQAALQEMVRQREREERAARAHTQVQAQAQLAQHLQQGLPALAQAVLGTAAEVKSPVHQRALLAAVDAYTVASEGEAALSLSPGAFSRNDF